VSGLVLSLFPGIGLLDMAFEQEGFCVVRGPDLLWGGDVRNFHAPRHRFDGVIGGPPCQSHSTMKHLALIGNGVPAGRHGDQIPEFCRIVSEAAPQWFVMENVPQAPEPKVKHYRIKSRTINNRWLGEDQNRKRRFSFGVGDWTPLEPRLEIQFAPLDSPRFEHAVLAGHGPAIGQRVRGIMGRDWREMARLQGLSPEWIEAFGNEPTFTVHGRKQVIGNGVPIPMGRAIARAVRQALGLPCEVSA
jgi:DNA (cytosine-5)-methyltransferase 1